MMHTRCSTLMLTLMLALMLAAACADESSTTKGGRNEDAGAGSGAGTAGVGGFGNPSQDSGLAGSGGSFAFDAAISDADVCGAFPIDVTTETTTEPGNVLIVFDQSNSMTTLFNGVPLWQAASDAVRDALTPYQDLLTIGAIFFPTDAFGGLLCDPSSVANIDTPPQIPFQAGPDFLTAWAARWTAANLVLSTPTPRAMLNGADAIANAGLSGATVVILVTDGGATCQTTPGSVDVATTWAGQGIATYVIGLPGSGPAQAELDAIAAAGGGMFLTPADSTTLQTELGKIVSSVVRRTIDNCDVTFTMVPDNLDQIDLVVTDATTGDRFRVVAGPNGWEPRADNKGATLLGTTCDRARAGDFSAIGFEFGCADIPPLE